MNAGGLSLTERLASGTAHVGALLLAPAALGVLRLFDPLTPDQSAAAWLVPAVAAGASIVVGTAALALLLTGLRRGATGPIGWAAALTAIAGGQAGAALGAPIAAVGVGGAGLLLLLGALAMHGTGRFGSGGLRLALAAHVVVATLLLAALVVPLEVLRGSHLVLAATGAAAAASAAGLAAGRGPWLGAALVSVGAVGLAVARPETLDAVVAPAALAAGALSMVAWPASGRARARPDDFADRGLRLGDLTGQLVDGALLFDGRLRLRDWNLAAAELLGMGPEAGGARLEELLATSLGNLQRRVPADLATSRRAPSGEPLELTLVPLNGEVLVLARDPAGPLAARQHLQRLTRELRATIEELMQARRTVELQRTELERAAAVDPLTGVASRAAMLERLRVEVAQARRYAHPVAVALIDLDGFAGINREHGILVGDAVLRETALRMRLRVREADALGRSAGDAFIAVLPHTDEEGAAIFADALRQRLVQRPVATSAGDLTVTASVGVAILRAGEELDVDGLLARADEALASARSGGGNRIALDRLHGLARLEERRSEPPRSDVEPRSGAEEA